MVPNEVMVSFLSAHFCEPKGLEGVIAWSGKIGKLHNFSCNFLIFPESTEMSEWIFSLGKSASQK